MFKKIAEVTGLPILVVEVPYIALRIAEPDLRGPDATAESIASALRLVKMERACVIGHSFGTVMTSWLLRHCPELVHSCVLIDPVCLLLTRAEVAYSVIHRQPRNAVDILLEYFVFRELSVAATLARYFIWYRNIIWAEQLPAGGRTAVVLSGEDVIVPSRAVLKYLTEHEITTVWLEEVGHAGFLLRESAVHRILDVICKVSSSSS
jgi:pimeloyl-ACP methyl ester carboxylesterase